MRSRIEAVTEELRRLRAAGVAQVYVGDETLQKLRGAVAGMQPRTPAAAAESVPTEEVHASVEVDTFAAPPVSRPRPSVAAETAVTRRWDGQPIAPIPAPPVVELPKGSKAERMAWLRERVLNCTVCNAHVRPGRKVVFGVGTENAEIFFCGEGPGAEEEQQGEPFVGPAGQLLTKIIQAMGLSREKVYIGNIMKWRPEMPSEWGNREPTPEEVAFSLPYLRAQLAIVQPKVIVALGKTAVSGLLGPDPRRKMTAIRGTWLAFEGTPLMPTFHPSYLLRNSAMAVKRQVWEDMMKVMERVGLPVSEKQKGFFTSGK
jgi:DNA polymerase